jgi:hypothetical protein
MENKAQEDQSSAVAVFSDHSCTENAIRALKNSGFDITKLSVLGKDFQSEDNVVGIYRAGDHLKYWGKMGAFWGDMWGLLAGSAFLIVPGIGPVVIAGPVASWIVSALEGAVCVGGMSALGAGLVSLGISKDKALKYEGSMKAGKLLLILHGTETDAIKARNTLESTEAEEIDIHQMPPEPARVG